MLDAISGLEIITALTVDAALFADFPNGIFYFDLFLAQASERNDIV